MPLTRYKSGFFFVVLVALTAFLLPASKPVGGQVITLTPAVTPTLRSDIAKQRITFQSGNLTLVGYLYKPNSGSGPFPGIIWNHGSEQNPGTGPEFDAIANIFVPAGYILFAPIRRGQGDSQGEYIQDQVAAERSKNGAQAANQLFVQLMEGPQLDDQLAGLAYLKSVPGVDTSRLAVTGCSYGGIQTLLGAESGKYQTAIAMSPGAESWAGNQALQDRLIKAVDNIHIPVFLIHPEDDANVTPGYVLGQEFQKLGKPYGLKIYPPFGTSDQQGHCFGGAIGFQIAGPDMLWFLSNTLH